MTSLGVTIADLRRQTRHIRILTSAALSPSTARKPDHLTELQDFGANPGNLRAWTFAPEGLAPGGALVVALHGCAQCADDYDKGAGWSALAAELNAAILFPEQRTFNNQRMCFNWFLSRDAATESGEAASIRQMIACMVERLRIAPNRIFVTGLSAGGAMAAALMALYPEVFSAGAVIAALPVGAASNAIEALHAMSDGATHAADLRASRPPGGRWPRIAIWQGAADAVVHPRNSDRLVEQWIAAHGLSLADGERGGGDGRTVWRDAWGRPKVERVLIEGLGHGAPIDSRNGGQPSAYMLDVGLDASRAMARFWGLEARAAHAPSLDSPPRRPLRTGALTLAQKGGAWANALLDRGALAGAARAARRRAAQVFRTK